MIIVSEILTAKSFKYDLIFLKTELFKITLNLKDTLLNKYQNIINSTNINPKTPPIAP